MNNDTKEGFKNCYEQNKELKRELEKTKQELGPIKEYMKNKKKTGKAKIKK